MADFRLSTETGDVIDEASFDDDREAITWRSSRPFEAPATDEGRQLRLQKHDGSQWVDIDALGTSGTT